MVRHKKTTRELLGGRPQKRSRVGKIHEPPQFKERKARKYRPGTVALREIRKYQTSTETLIPKRSFQRLVKEIMDVECCDREIFPGMKIQSPALLSLQWASEQYVTELFQKGQLAAIHGKRITVQPKDFDLVKEFRGDNMKFNKPSDHFLKELRFKRFMEQLRQEVESELKRVLFCWLGLILLLYVVWFGLVV